MLRAFVPCVHNLYVCVCACVCVCVRVSMCVSLHVCLSVCLSMSVYLCACMCIKSLLTRVCILSFPHLTFLAILFSFIYIESERIKPPATSCAQGVGGDFFFELTM